jgi:hypothetical protein
MAELGESAIADRYRLSGGEAPLPASLASTDRSTLGSRSSLGGQPQSVLDALKPYQEDRRIDDDRAPIRVCHRDLSRRLDQLH